MARDGKSRYNIMSLEKKQQFIDEQKKLGTSFNIGFSSPNIDSYAVTINENKAEIIYDLSDSSKNTYQQHEYLEFIREKNVFVVNKAIVALEDWSRYYCYTFKAEDLIKQYTKSLQNKEYISMLSYTPLEKLDRFGHTKLKSVEIGEIKLKSKDIRESKAYIELHIDILNKGESNLNNGLNIKSLYLVKGESGWYIEQIKENEKPQKEWWSN